jgi:hypothetical protein
VSRERFDLKYEPVASGIPDVSGIPGVPGVPGIDGPHRAKPLPVLAKQLAEPFTIAREAGGDLLKGLAHDWVMQYAPGDYGVVENARFQQVYRAQFSRLP